ncbi:MAG: hypothetical protein ACI4EG_09730 [Fusicatenibacter sp.]
MGFKIFLICHSHIDIGYTERQEKMKVYQADFMRQAVDCVLHPAGTKTPFKFTAEGFWAIEEYLKRYGEGGRLRLLEAVKTGRFEITAGYCHFAELLNYENLRESVNHSMRFAERNHITPPKSFMLTDVNGLGWGYAQVLADAGVENVFTCINPHHGGVPFGKPLVPFYWKTPKGDTLLVWSGLTYDKANLLGLIPGFAPGGNPGIPGMLPDNKEHVNVTSCDSYASGRLFDFVNALKNNGYEYDFAPITGGAVCTDNNPINDGHCRIIDEWNEKYKDQIEIVTVTLNEFFEYLKRAVPNIETYEGDWPDWWTDGCLSTPAETKVFRNAQRTQKLIRKLDKDGFVTKAERDEIANNLILYAEHTWGHSSSCSDPNKLLVQQLDLRKAKLAVDADVQSSTALDKLSRVLGEGEFCAGRPMEYMVINPHEDDISSVVCLPTDFWEEGHFLNRSFYVTDESGHRYPAQRAYNLRGAFILVPVDLKARETRLLKIGFSDAEKEETEQHRNWFRNPFYEVKWDDTRIVSIVNLATGSELLCESDGDLGQPVYQVFENANRGDPAGFGFSARKIPESKIFYGKSLGVEILSSGEISTTIRINYEIRSAKKCYTDFVFYNHLPRIDVNINMAKDLVIDPEGMYVLLPVEAKRGEWYLDKPGILFKAGTSLPETCHDYFAVERGMVSKGEREIVTVNSLDTPLFTIGGLKLWKYTTSIDPRGPLFSWIVNNKWETNFRIDCAGFLENRYVITIGNENSNPEEMLEHADVEPLVLRK